MTTKRKRGGAKHLAIAGGGGAYCLPRRGAIPSTGHT
jgi:hypothetical protein